MTTRNRVMTREELLDELVARRAPEGEEEATRERASAFLDDLADLGADPVGRAKKLVDEEIGA